MPSPRSSSSSFERLPRQPDEYSLKSQDDPDNSQLVANGRDSFDPAPVHQEQSTSEPLLPTSNYRPPFQEQKRFSCTVDGMLDWMRGPSPPHKYRINPWLARWQTAPGRLIDRYFRSTKAKCCLLLVSLMLWGIVFLSILHASVAGQEIPGYGNPVKLSCWSKLWYDPRLQIRDVQLTCMYAGQMQLIVDLMEITVVHLMQEHSHFAVLQVARPSWFLSRISLAHRRLITSNLLLEVVPMKTRPKQSIEVILLFVKLQCMPDISKTARVAVAFCVGRACRRCSRQVRETVFQALSSHLTSRSPSPLTGARPKKMELLIARISAGRCLHFPSLYQHSSPWQSQRQQHSTLLSFSLSTSKLPSRPILHTPLTTTK